MRKLLISIGLLAMPCASRAQAPQDPWGALNSLRASQKIEVIEKTLKKHVGTFMTVSAEAIQLREGAADDAIRREDVLRVSLPEKRHRALDAIHAPPSFRNANLRGLGSSGFPSDGLSGIASSVNDVTKREK